MLLKSHNEYLPGMSKWKRKKILDISIDLQFVNEDKDPDPPLCCDKSVWIPLRNREHQIINWSLIDREDFEKVSKYKWHVTIINNKKYAANNNRIHMHVLLIGKAPNNMVIDHVDYNGQLEDYDSGDPKNKVLAANILA